VFYMKPALSVSAVPIAGYCSYVYFFTSIRTLNGIIFAN